MPWPLMHIWGISVCRCGGEPVCGVRPIWGQSTLETSEADFYPETKTKTIKAKPERRVDSGLSE